MEEQFKKCFLSDLQIIWAQKTFLEHRNGSPVKHLLLSAQEEFSEFSCNTKFKTEFRKRTLIRFWLSVKTKYPLVAELAFYHSEPLIGNGIFFHDQHQNKAVLSS